MSKDKVKRARKLANKKPTRKQLEEKKQFELEKQQKEELFKERAEFHTKVLQAKQVWKIGERKAKEIRTEFESKRNDYASYNEFKQAKHKLITQQKQVLDGVKKKYLELNKAYKDKYELGTYKFRRWFFGMGKEFERITWCNSKTLWTSFLTIVIIVVILAILFFLVGMIPGIKVK